jgi:hypothetical protein
VHRRTAIRIAAPLAALTLLTAACGDDSDNNGRSAPTTMSPSTSMPSSDVAPTSTGSATLRATLTGLLSEHITLAANATGAALRGDTAGFEAYAAALNGPTGSNTADIVAAITSVYGEEVGTAFDGLWRSNGHIPAVVAYTQAIAKDDKAAADKAVRDLLAYAKTFGTTISSVNSNLPADAVEEAVKGHITTLKDVIDAQKAKNPTKEYTALRAAYSHMVHFADTLAGATVKQFPDKFDGDPASSGSELRSGLTALLQEHVTLAASATGAALDGRQAEFEAAATALNGPTDSNTSDLVDAITSVYGEEVGTAFDGLWRSNGHIPGFVAYTQAVGKGDEAAADKAVADLKAYAKTFGTTLNSVNENLPADAVEAAITMHATTLIAVIDAQASGDAQEAAAALREAAHHMSDTAKVLADATAKKFPEKFAA